MYCVIVSGLSGAGKSVALKAFEDSGFYCVDNLPVALIPTLTDLVVQSKIECVALGIDIREREFFADFSNIIHILHEGAHRLDIVFFEARDEILARRYSETRRRHPLAEEGAIVDSIRLERERLETIRRQATRLIDTSDFTVHELRKYIQDLYNTHEKSMHIALLSFGFKYGVPSHTDLVFDVRFLPNPHFVPDLRVHTGIEPRVAQYVLSNPVAAQFLPALCEFLAMLLPWYQHEGKAYLTISIGCTGGKHRSVATAEEAATSLRRLGYRVNCQHRDIMKQG